MEASFFSQNRYRHICLFSRESLCNQVFFDPHAFCLERVRDDIASLIRCLTDSATILGSEILESLENGSEFSRFSQDSIAIVDESRLVDYTREVGEDLGLEGLYLIDHIEN